ncbi:MAG: hypothetical protein ACRDOO_14720 [Actinomadura sp.]
MAARAPKDVARVAIEASRAHGPAYSSPAAGPTWPRSTTGPFAGAFRYFRWGAHNWLWSAIPAVLGLVLRPLSPIGVIAGAPREVIAVGLPHLPALGFALLNRDKTDPDEPRNPLILRGKGRALGQIPALRR